MTIFLPNSIFRSVSNLQKTKDFSEAAFDRLISGQKYTRVQDGPDAYFKQKALTEAALKFDSYQSASDSALGLIDVSLSGAQAAKSLLAQMKGRLIDSKNEPLYDRYIDGINDKSGNKERIKLSREFDAMVTQIESVLADSTYQGMNLLAGRQEGAVYRADNQYNFKFSDNAFIALTGKYLGTNSWYEYIPNPDIGIFGADTITNVFVQTLVNSPKFTTIGSPFTFWKPVRLEGNSLYNSDPGAYLRLEVTDYSAEIRELRYYAQSFSGSTADDVTVGADPLQSPRSGLGLFYSYLYDGLATEKGVDGAIFDLEKASGIVDASIQSLGIQANIIKIRQEFNNALATVYRDGAQKIQEIDPEEDAAIIQRSQVSQNINLETVKASFQADQMIADMISGFGGNTLIDIRV